MSGDVGTFLNSCECLNDVIGYNFVQSSIRTYHIDYDLT